MSAPDRIWLSEPDECNYHEVWFDSDYGGTEYIRTDLVAITTQPDPRDEVIRALMESLETIASNQCCDAEPWYIAYAALAAAKAVAK